MLRVLLAPDRWMAEHPTVRRAVVFGFLEWLILFLVWVVIAVNM